MKDIMKRKKKSKAWVKTTMAGVMVKMNIPMMVRISPGTAGSKMLRKEFHLTGKSELFKMFFQILIKCEFLSQNELKH